MRLSSPFWDLPLACLARTRGTDRVSGPHRDDPEATNDEQLRLEQDVLSPLAHTHKLFAYRSTSPWVQIKSAA